LEAHAETVEVNLVLVRHFYLSRDLGRAIIVGQRGHRSRGKEREAGDGAEPGAGAKPVSLMCDV
jgi:hypothetical protein